MNPVLDDHSFTHLETSELKILMGGIIVLVISILSLHLASLYLF